jgi:predicted O-methyltransferase YrrM
VRTFAHWTPRYVAARCREIVDHWLRPEDPWLTREAIGLLDRLLRPTDIALEFGAGRSTAWIARRVSKLTSVESDDLWFRRVGETLNAGGISNVDLLHRQRDVPEVDGASATYVRVLDDIPDLSVDFVLVDGIYRNYCALRSIAKIKPCGLIVVDNVNWFLPSHSLSPNSRTEPADATWQQFADLTRDCRRIWTTSGATDPLILFKR